MSNRHIIYVGHAPKKTDNVLRSGREWAGHGHILEVPEKDAEVYCRYPDVWADVTDLEAEAIETLDGTSEASEKVAATVIDPTDPDAALKAAEEQHEQQLLAVVNAIGDLDPKNNAHFTGQGKPNAQALTEAVDFPVNAKLRDEAWALLQEAADDDGDEAEEGSDE